MQPRWYIGATTNDRMLIAQGVAPGPVSAITNPYDGLTWTVSKNVGWTKYNANGTEWENSAYVDGLISVGGQFVVTNIRGTNSIPLSINIGLYLVGTSPQPAEIWYRYTTQKAVETIDWSLSVSSTKVRIAALQFQNGAIANLWNMSDMVLNWLMLTKTSA